MHVDPAGRLEGRTIVGVGDSIADGVGSTEDESARCASDTLADLKEHVSAQRIIEGMDAPILRAHARGINIWGATLLPYQNTVMPPNAGFHGSFYTAAGDAKRQAVNDWIRTAHAFDAVIDFDKSMRDPAHPAHPERLRSDFDSGDHLHPNDAGYKAMAGAIDRRLLLPAT